MTFDFDMFGCFSVELILSIKLILFESRTYSF